MPKKYYAVRTGRNTGVFETWEECRSATHGFPGAIFKSFLSRADAEAFLSGGALQDAAADGLDGAVAYVDGSYDPVTARFACGAVLFQDGVEVRRFSEAFDDPSLAEMRNIAGEIKGAETVLRYCLSEGIPAVTVCHDYQGVASWATGDWKANKEGTKAYRTFCLAAMQQMEVRFRKVKGHSGDPGNDLADALAKAALGIGGKKQMEAE